VGRKINPYLLWERGDTYIFSTNCDNSRFISRLVVFLSMQKSFEQLDLFGFPVTKPAKKEPAPKKAVASNEQVIATPPTIHAAAPMVTAAVVEKEVPERKTVDIKSTSKRGRKSFKEMDSEADLIDIPDDLVLQQKLYYSISEVASWFKVNTSLLRFWENEFDILQPRKTRKGDRLFRVEDIKNLQLIYFLLRQRKFSIDGAKNYLKNNKKEVDTQVQLVQSLTKFKSFLLEVKRSLGN
jgi:DNA-binding transcriptional MerR regulator